MSVSPHVRTATILLGIASIAVAITGSAASDLRGQAGQFSYQEWFNLHYAGSAPLSSVSPSSSVSARAPSSNPVDPSIYSDPFLPDAWQSFSSAPASSARSVTTGTHAAAEGSSQAARVPTSGDMTSTASAVSVPAVHLAHSCAFADLESQTLEQTAALWLCNRGIVTGVADGRMAPADTLNRAQAATMVVRALGLPVSLEAASFTDVPASAWYAPTVAVAQAQGIVTGYPDGTFKPEQPVGRAELASMLVRAFNLSVDGVHGAAPTVPQDVQAGQWYQQPVETALAHNLFPGDPQRFSPLRVANRSNAIIALYQAMKATGRE